jgi:hypothetical protein
MEKNSLNKIQRSKWLWVLMLPVLIACLFSCGKSGSECFTSSGSIIKQSRPVEDFDTISANQNVDIILTQDTINSIVVEAGEKIINGITTQFNNRRLVIGNTNTCNWVRSFDKPLNVYVHARNLRKIWYLSAGNITATNSFNSDSFVIDVWGGCGSISLTLYTGLAFIYEHMGTADITVKGHSVSSSIVSGDFGLLQLKDMEADYCYVKNSGSNDCYVNSKKFLDATIKSIGNIYYTGNPDSIKLHMEGSGSLIKF